MYGDLKFYINLKVKNVPRTYTGRIINNEKGNQLQLDRICSSLPKDEQDAFQYSKLDYIVCHANNGKQYAFYNLVWTETQSNYGQDNIVLRFTLTFEELIENPTLDKLYNGISFSFDHIDSIFGRTSFDTQFPLQENNNEIKLTLSVPNDLNVNLDNQTEIRIYSEFDGLVSSYSLYDLNIIQKKRIYVKFPNRISLDEICNTIIVIKLYFEFIYSYKMGFKEVLLVDDKVNYKESKIKISKLYSLDPMPSTVFKNRYNGNSEELTKGIKLWFELYDKFIESILIWKKTIYNLNIDLNDKYLWICQAFESMCQNDKDIYSKALENAKEKNAKSTYPNLSDYLKTVEDIIDFKFTNRDKYYKNIVKVRDKLTHNNPKKSITEVEKDESYRLIEYFYLSIVVSKLGRLKIARMISLP